MTDFASSLDASLDWEVQELPIYNEEGKEINGYKQLLNSNTSRTLAVCKKSYTPTKNEKFLEVVEHLKSQLGFTIDGFASFQGGKKVLAYLKNPNPQNLVGLPVQDYMIVGNAHDGSSSFFTGMTNVVYRCTNMFSSTRRDTRISHRQGHENKIDESLKTYEMYFNAKTGFYEMMQDFEGKPVQTEQKRDFVNTVLQIEPEKELSTRMQNIKESLYNCIEVETSELGNNAFGLFNGMTRYTTHELNSKQKLFGNPFGHANTLNKRALAFCQELETRRNPKTFVLDAF